MATADKNTVMATGRRKTAVARIQMIPGQGKVEVNGRDFEDYFTTPAMKTLEPQPTAMTTLKPQPPAMTTLQPKSPAMTTLQPKPPAMATLKPQPTAMTTLKEMAESADHLPFRIRVGHTRRSESTNS